MELPDLTGRHVLITGGNSGIGRETAVALAGAGATVTITSRDPVRGADALADIRARSANDDVRVLPLDLASSASVRAAAAELLARDEPLHVLVNNAGALVTRRQFSAEGIELTFATNHLGHFQLTTLLTDRLVASGSARIVNVSSIAHRFARTGLAWSDLEHRSRYSPYMVYGESKLANLLFTRALAARLESSGVVANACHPGVVRSGFGVGEENPPFTRFYMRLGRPIMVSPARGSAPLVWLAGATEAASSSGGYVVGGYRRGVRPSIPSAAARDDEAARRLWQTSDAILERACSSPENKT